ncbi:MAG: rod shape-determining protein MreC [Actinomycetota bacterium]|nr:rod shape-determining protein MreC [Actinomycetota bacterium]
MRGTRRLRLVLVLLLLTAFTLTTLDYRYGSHSPFDAVRRGLDTVFGPAQRAVGGAARAVGDALGGLPRLGRYQDDNRRLQLENARLREQLRQTDDLRRQLAEYDRLMHLKDLQSYSIKAARVVTIGSALGFEWTATIDVGSKDGIQPDQTVISGDGLVGRTKRVGPYTSVVVLLADKGFDVGVRLARSGAFGIATGNALNPMTYQLIGQNFRANLGDTFITTGSSTFVSGVPVGKVTSLDTTSNTLTKTGLVTPFVDVTRLDWVGVVVDGPRTLPRPLVTPVPIPTQSSAPSQGPASPSAPPAGGTTPAPTPTRTGTAPTSRPGATPTRSP